MVVALAVGCYVNTPPAAILPEPGVRMVVELNDQGRIALGRNLGPDVLTVWGRFVDGSDSVYRIAVTSTQTLDRRRVPWGGETVSVSRDYVRRFNERRLSKGRTVVFAVALGAAVGVFILTRSLFGFADSPPDPSDTTGNGT